MSVYIYTTHLFAHLVVWADVEDADVLGDGLPLAQGRGHGAAWLADQERLTKDEH